MEKPAPTEIWRAIEIYLRIAYDTAPPPVVQKRLDALRSTSEGEFFACPAIERNSSEASTRLSIRLGNPWYPHMKLSIDQRPDRQGTLFRADTHDRQFCPAPGSPEHAQFQALMER